jgi:hypothetical protein
MSGKKAEWTVYYRICGRNVASEQKTPKRAYRKGDVITVNCDIPEGQLRDGDYEVTKVDKVVHVVYADLKK